MHPLILFVCFIVFAAFVALGDFYVSLFGLFVLGLFWGLFSIVPTKRAWKMLLRMKLFFISILLLYVWFTPGKLVVPVMDHWSPTYEGLYFGSERILALIILVMAVDSLLTYLPKEKILTALYYFFTPLDRLGFDRERFVVRTYLTLDAVSSGEQRFVAIEKQHLSNFSAYLDAVAAHIDSLLHSPMKKEMLNQEVVIEIDKPPALTSWAVPVGLLLCFAGVYLW